MTDDPEMLADSLSQRDDVSLVTGCTVDAFVPYLIADFTTGDGLVIRLADGPPLVRIKPSDPRNPMIWSNNTFGMPVVAPPGTIIDEH